MALYIAQDGFATCAYCGQPITPHNDFRFVMVGGKPAKAHRLCGPAYGEAPRG